MNLEQFRLTEKVKLSYLMHRGDPIKVSSELSLPLDVVNKYIKKFKKQEERNVSQMISNTLMQTILLGYNSRITIFHQTLNLLNGKETVSISVCCEAPIISIDSKPHCASCNLPANVKVIDKEGIYSLKLEILSQLREEDKALIVFAEKMGYTQNKEEPPPQRIQNNFIVMNNSEETKLDPKIVQDISALGALERDILVENLQKQIIDVPSEQKKEDVK